MARIPLLLTTRETVAILRVQRPKIYDLIKGGVIEGVRVGADWRITTASVERLCGMKIPDSYFTNGKLNVGSTAEQSSIRNGNAAHEATNLPRSSFAKGRIYE